MKTPDGKVHHMTEGQMMTMDGKMMEGSHHMKDHKGMMKDGMEKHN